MKHKSHRNFVIGLTISAVLRKTSLVVELGRLHALSGERELELAPGRSKRKGTRQHTSVNSSQTNVVMHETKVTGSKRTWHSS